MILRNFIMHYFDAYYETDHDCCTANFESANKVFVKISKTTVQTLYLI